MPNFNLIYAKSGTGKSEYIYKDIDKKIDKFYIWRSGFISPTRCISFSEIDPYSYITVA